MKQMIIYDWMLTKLCLKPNEVLIYAYIYNHTDPKGEEHQFSGSVDKLSEEVGMIRKTAYVILQKLIEYGLVDKSDSIYDPRALTYKANKTRREEW